MHKRIEAMSQLSRVLNAAFVLCGSPPEVADAADISAARTLAALVQFERAAPSYNETLRGHLLSVTTEEAMAEYERLRRLTAGAEAMSYQWLATKLLKVYCCSGESTGATASTRGAVYSGLRLFAKYIALSAVAQRELQRSGDAAPGTVVAAESPLSTQSRRLVRFQQQPVFGIDFIARQCVEISASIMDSALPRMCSLAEYNERSTLHKNHICAVFKFDVVEPSPVEFLIPLEPAMEACHAHLLLDVLHVIDQLVVWPEFSLQYANYASVTAFAAIYFSAKRFLQSPNEQLPLHLDQVAAVCPAAALLTRSILAAEGP